MTNEVTIGGVKLASPTVMAPIAGMTDEPYRRMVMEQGCGLTVSELISANALTRESEKTFAMLPAPDEPRPVATQIFGGDPAVMAEAARIVDEADRCDLIDLNYGCPVKKVTKCGAGSAMLKDLTRARDTLAAVVSAVKKPVTVKFRIGWDASSPVAVDLAKALADGGAAALAVHGRTAAQGYGGRADWGVIERVAAAVDIPVIGNGDILTPEEAVARLRNHGCAAVMIGRGALGNPWLFAQINDLLAGRTPTTPTREVVRDDILRHMRLMERRYGDPLAARMMRSHFAYYSRGRFGARDFRQAANAADTLIEQEALVRFHFDRDEAAA